MNKTFKLTALERSWILYDIGNSAFILMVSTLIPIYFNALASSAGVDENLYLSYWGYAGSIATVLVAIIGPICGALSDRNQEAFVPALRGGGRHQLRFAGLFQWVAAVPGHFCSRPGGLFLQHCVL